jgi:DNA polymerase (family 10)
LAVKKPSEELAASISEAIKSLSIVERVVASGSTRIAFDLKSGLRTDIRILSDELWGSALLYFTGSKEHNISLRRRAIEQNMKLSEYGLFKNEKVIASRTEEEIYKTLGVPFVEPENRTAELP